MRAANFFILGVDKLYYKQYNVDRKRKGKLKGKEVIKMKLIHGSFDKLTDLTVRAGDLYNGMFFSSSKRSAHGPGISRYYYSVDIPDEDIGEAWVLAYEEASVDAAKELWGEDYITMLDIVSDEINYNSADDEQREVLDRLFPGNDYGEMQWELQRQASLLAEKMGYKAVAVHDEHGTSYIVCPGSVMKEEE